jgi:hypothetical protein
MIAIVADLTVLSRLNAGVAAATWLVSTQPPHRVEGIFDTTRARVAKLLYSIRS